MKESLQHQPFGRLSPVATEALIRGEITSDLVGRIQSETQAYFDFRKDIFGGVLYHRDGKGPEKPYFKPDGNDWLPEVQAISRIGVQYHYWNMLHDALEKRTLDPARLMSLEILALHPNLDGSSCVEIDYDFDRLKNVVKRCGDTLPKYPCYIPSINFGGDADFYGSDENQIFPMDVKASDGKRVYVAREKLGIEPEIDDNAWQSWINIHRTDNKLYHQSVLDSCRGLPSVAVKIIERDLGKGEKFSGAHAVLRSSLLKGIDDDELFDRVLSVTDGKARETMTGNRELLKAAKDHAENLFLMYDTARKNRSDIYRY